MALSFSHIVIEHMYVLLHVGLKKPKSIISVKKNHNLLVNISTKRLW